MINEALQPSRGKIVWGLGRLMPYVRWYINTSRFIPTAEKDGLVKRIEEIVRQLEDAQKREQGVIPYPPSVQKALTPQKPPSTKPQ